MTNFSYINKELNNSAKNAITQCIEQYSNYVQQTGIAKSTANKYNSIIKLVVGDFIIPISQITTKQLDEYIAELCYEKNWSKTYTKNVISVISKFFIWCKDRSYTLVSHILTNPIDGTKPIVKADITPKEEFVSVRTDNTPKPVINLVDSNTTTKSNYNMIKFHTARDIAILYLCQDTNIKPEEIIYLSIYDFLHNKIVVQSINNRHNMRIVSIDTKTRNLIYNYLSNRNDNNEALFLSETHTGERITLEEVQKFCE